MRYVPMVPIFDCGARRVNPFSVPISKIAELKKIEERKLHQDWHPYRKAARGLSSTTPLHKSRVATQCHSGEHRAVAAASAAGEVVSSFQFQSPSPA